MSDINVTIEDVSRKKCNKIFGNKKKFTKSNNGKHNFREGTKIFVNESLTPMNGFIAFNCRKLKLKELIHSCYSRNRVLNIKMTDKSRPVKIFHMESLVNLFLWILILRLEKRTWMHPRILMPLYIQPTNFKYSSVE